MQCPQCIEEGKRSTIVLGGGSRTLLGWTPYYDEDGNYHSHDPNRTSSSGQCSNGHRLHIRSGARCPSCEYGSKVEITVDKTPPPEPRVYLGKLSTNTAASEALQPSKGKLIDRNSK